MMSVNAQSAAAIAVIGEGKMLFGESELLDYISGKYCCSVHRVVEDVIGPVGLLYTGKLGTHPAFSHNAYGWESGCCADGLTLRKDRLFASGAISGVIPGFQFNVPNALPGVRKFATGTVAGLGAFGRGYCYLSLIRPDLRFRIARILGPAPLVSDLLCMYRVSGACQHRVVFSDLGNGCWHVEEGGRVVGGREMYWHLLGMVKDDARCRLGVDKEFCADCGCDINPVGHESRCKRPLEFSRVDAWVGDALHSLDLHMHVARLVPLTVNRDALVAGYMEDAGQRAAMEDLGIYIGKNWNDRDCSNWFESHYDLYRADYCEWLRKDLLKYFSLDLTEPVDMPSVGPLPGPIVDRSAVDIDLMFRLAVTDVRIELCSGSRQLISPWGMNSVRIWDVRRVVVAVSNSELNTIVSTAYLSKQSTRSFMESVLEMKGLPEGEGKSLARLFSGHYYGTFRLAFIYYVAKSLVEKT